MNLCKDCKHYKSGVTAIYDRCHRDVSAYNDVIRGELHKTDNWNWCADERNSSNLISFFNGKCGVKGRYWEAK